MTCLPLGTNLFDIFAASEAREWIESGIQVTFGRDADAYFLELLKPCGVRHRYSDTSFWALFVKAKMTFRKMPANKLLEPIPALTESQKATIQDVTTLCQKVVESGLAENSDSARRAIYNMTKEDFLCFREPFKHLSRVDFNGWEKS